MDLFGFKRRNKDLILLEKSQHSIAQLGSRLTCSCGWENGRGVDQMPQHEIDSYFAGHIRASRFQRGW